MKNLLVALLALSSSSAFAAPTLNCWKTDFHPSTPFLSASIVGKNKLADIRFNYKDSLKDTDGDVKGEVIATNHSPYKGNVRYSIDAGDLILPADLSNDNLESVEKGGIGYYKGENGVIISSVDGDGEGGNHVSYRLSCRSTK